MTASPAPPGFAQRLTLVIQALRHTIAARAGRDRSAAPLVLLVWPYLHRVAMRFEALALRLQSGRLQSGRAAAAPAKARAAANLRPRTARLPGGFAWLIRFAPEAAPLGGQLRHLLADPDFSTLLADPRAGKILRPLCRMLGVAGPDLPPLLRPQPPRRAAPAAPAIETQATQPPAAAWPPSQQVTQQQVPCRLQPLPRLKAAPA